MLCGKKENKQTKKQCHRVKQGCPIFFHCGLKQVILKEPQANTWVWPGFGHPWSKKFSSFWSCSECNRPLGVACRHVSSVEFASTCGSGSDAACSASIWKHEEGQRVSGKIQMSGRRLVASFKLRESFVIHHPQHFTVEFGRPSGRDGRSADGEMTDDLKVLIYF